MATIDIRPATAQDIPAIVSLVNSAYRGSAARQGWTHEADLIEGEARTDEKELATLLIEPEATILKCTDDNTLVGSVYLKRETHGLYLGMLSVSPNLQAKGIGKQLLNAAEEHTRLLQCSYIEITVISVGPNY
ncbi:MAG: family acetyltransferase [Flaviaesturariibacter sp.]|nr:family acetyltransferase [Flaviaesturariibacter sp.]